MKFFYDTEFLERNGYIFPISIGIVSDEPNNLGIAEYYAVLEDAQWGTIVSNEWIRIHVISNLGSSNNFKPLWLIRNEISAFIKSFGGTSEDNELWAYYGAYDHVVLSQIYGRMLDIPEPVPMYTNDIMTLAHMHGLPDPQLDGDHNALKDAEHVREAYKRIMKQIKKGQDK